MGMTTKFVEIKLCKTCNQNLNYKKFRKVNRLTKGPNKGKYVGWTDINGGKRLSKCKSCEIDRARNRVLRLTLFHKCSLTVKLGLKARE